MSSITLETLRAEDKPILTLRSEEEARDMYKRSALLKNEYPTVGCFIGYWRALKQKGKEEPARVRGSVPSMGGPTNETSDQQLRRLENEKEAKEFWDRTPAVREEFGEFKIFVSYWGAMRQGLVTPHGFGRKPPKKS